MQSGGIVGLEMRVACTFGPHASLALTLVDAESTKLSRVLSHGAMHIHKQQTQRDLTMSLLCSPARQQQIFCKQCSVHSCSSST